MRTFIYIFSDNMVKKKDNLENKEVFGKATKNIVDGLNKLWQQEQNQEAFEIFCNRLIDAGLTKEIYNEALKYAKPPIKNPIQLIRYQIDTQNYELNFLDARNGKKLLTLIYEPHPDSKGIFKVKRATLYKQEV